MKKRIISMLLALTMMVGMVPTFAVNVGAQHNPYHVNGQLCYMLPYAYNAMQWSSPNYYIAHYNIQHVYNYENLKKSFDKGIPQTLANSLDNKANSTLVVINEIFNFDGEFTEQDLYDYLLTSMLIGNAVSDAQGVEVEDANKIKDILNMSVDGIEVSNGVVFSGKLIDLLKKFDFSNTATVTKTLNSINEKSKNVYSKLTAKLPNGSFGSFFTVLSCVLQTIEEIDEAYKICAAYEIIYERLGDDAGLVLQYMEQSTYDPLLKASISKYERIVSSDDYWNTVVATGLIEGLNATEEITVNILSTVSRSLITAQLVAASSVWGAFFIGYAIADLWLGISDYVECINEIARFNLIDKTLLTTIASLEQICINNFDKEASVKYCDAYVFAMKMAWRLQTTELEKCQEFFEKGQKKGWFGNYYKDPNKLEQWNNSINYCINAVDTVKPRNFINNALKQYNYDLDLIIDGYTITYDLNGGVGYIPGGTKKYNETYTLTEIIPTKDGSSFMGWQLGKSSYSSGMELESTLNPCWCSRELVFKAYWIEQDTIIYNANGGNGAPASHENTVGNTTLSTTVPTRTGHTFLGWSESETATTATYQPGDVFTKEGNVTLYAVWEAGVFDIVFHANGGKFSDNSDSKTMQKTYLKNFTVSPEVPTRDGYTFSGEWTENADGSGHHIYQGTTLTDIDGKSGLHTRHFYAQWNSLTHPFRYDYNNCSDCDDLTLPLNNGVLSVKLVDPPQNILDKFAAAGKKFVKWMYIKPDGSTEYYKSGDTLTITNPGEPRECVYAIWEVASSGALLSVLTDKTSYLPGDTATLTITADNSGYFTVDVSDNNGFKIKCADGSNASSGVFVENSSASTSNTLKCYDNGSSYTVKVYIPNNCSDGSYTVNIVASNGTYGVNGTETSKVAETITITVDTSEEEADSYSLLYHPNGGYGTVPDTERFKEGEKVEIMEPSELKRDGYVFSHWTNDEDGDGKTYKVGRTYRFTDDVILYAQWKVDKTADVSKELELFLRTVNSNAKTGVNWYKPGDVIGLEVNIDNSDHFYVSVQEHLGWTLLHANGKTDIQSVFYEKNAPGYDGKQQTYTNGGSTIVSIQIPKNCRDGEYNIIVKGADKPVNSSGSSDGKILPVGITITVRANEQPDEVLLNKSEIILHKGNKTRLTATIVPEFVYPSYLSTKPKSIKWSSSDTSVATVDKTGEWVNVRSVGTGTATITATFNGVSASSKVTVVRCNHSIKEIDNDYLASPATCTSQATYYYVCECGDKGTSTYKHGDLAAHNYSAWSVIQQATETTAGIEQRTCSGCQNTEERSIPATGAHTTHTPGTTWHSDSEKHWHVCSVDGCTIKLNEGTHIFGELSVETPATETNTGVGYRTCTCGYSKSEVIPIIEHVHDWNTTYSKDATHHWYTCSKCTDIKEKSEHSWNSGVETIPATETSSGIMTYTCIVCSYAKNSIIPPLEHSHSWMTTWSKNTEKHWHACSGCTEVKDEANHTWDNGVITKPATESSTGIKTYTCTVCDYSKTETIPKVSTNGFQTNFNIGLLNGKWNTESDGSGTDYDTVLIEYQLKGDGIINSQAAWIAIDLTQLVWVDNSKDGVSVNDYIGAGKAIVPGESPVGFNIIDGGINRTSNFYMLKAPVVVNNGTVDEWSFRPFSLNYVAVSEDGKTLYLCPQPCQIYGATYEDFTTVVSFRFGVLPGTQLSSDAVRYISESERQLLCQSFIILMCDGVDMYCYGDAAGEDTLQAGTFTYISGGSGNLESNYSISGRVTSYDAASETIIHLLQDGEVRYSTTINAEEGSSVVTQEFAISGVELGTYDMVIAKARHLPYMITDITVDGDVDLTAHENEQISSIVLLAGDVNSDGCIDLQDVTVLTSSNTYGKTYDEAMTKSADINGDKCFDLQDLAIVTSEKNYGKAKVEIAY